MRGSGYLSGTVMLLSGQKLATVRKTSFLFGLGTAKRAEDHGLELILSKPSLVFTSIFFVEVIFYFWQEAVITAGNWWMITSINSKRIYQGRLWHIRESEGTDILIVKKSLPKNCMLLRSELRVESFRISFLGAAKNKSSTTDV